jgi:hypothetical protein
MLGLCVDNLLHAALNPAIICQFFSEVSCEKGKKCKKMEGKGGFFIESSG